MGRTDDLAVLGLSYHDGEAEDSRGRIRKAYLRLSRSHHPDKGGTKEAFQNLTASYHRLVHDEVEGGDTDEEQTETRQDHRPSDAYDDFYENEAYDDYFDFFHTHNEYDFEDYDEYEDVFASWEDDLEERRKAWSEHHKQQLRLGIDYRDRRASAKSKKCMFCGVKAAITKITAKQNGLNWEEYRQSTKVDGYQEYLTCWACKTNHVSVLTENQACRKFAKKLDIKATSKGTGNQYNPVFWALKRAKRSFHHTPQTNMYAGPSRTSEYFWYPDLEREALARGWKPRGKMKDTVPWTRKDNLSTSLVPATQSLKKKKSRSSTVSLISPTKKRKGEGYGSDDDNKTRSKPRKEIPTSLVPASHSLKKKRSRSSTVSLSSPRKKRKAGDSDCGDEKNTRTKLRKDSSTTLVPASHSPKKKKSRSSTVSLRPPTKKRKAGDSGCDDEKNTRTKLRKDLSALVPPSQSLKKKKSCSSTVSPSSSRKKKKSGKSGCDDEKKTRTKLHNNISAALVPFSKSQKKSKSRSSIPTQGSMRKEQKYHGSSSEDGKKLRAKSRKDIPIGLLPASEPRKKKKSHSNIVTPCSSKRKHSSGKHRKPSATPRRLF